MHASLRSFQSIYPTLGERVYIDSSAVLVGDIHIGADASIWPLVAARGDVNHIRIGARSNIQDGTVLHVTHKNAENPEGHPLLIGDDVTVGHQAMLHGCTIENQVLVGMSSVVLDGAYIESQVLIGAGSLVPPHKRLVSGYLYVGRPVKQVRPLTEDELAWLQRSADNYVALKAQYLKEAIHE
ncbi:Protein YrdA [Vibrio stylophorae]|uniref:Protein YrdA n=1 Tax=Vibrio stylophorae TaxID=659351 RepID=A0ABN8DR81_9VIBR|nr:gamma carbonic anhydrase family protein [Vibrio stylophorae]CAH0532285.1 Protein YrdA [Vibrio stylophorae]